MACRLLRMGRSGVAAISSVTSLAQEVHQDAAADDAIHGTAWFVSEMGVRRTRQHSGAVIVDRIGAFAIERPHLVERI